MEKMDVFMRNGLRMRVDKDKYYALHEKALGHALSDSERFAVLVDALTSRPNPFVKYVDVTDRINNILSA